MIKSLDNKEETTYKRVKRHEKDSEPQKTDRQAEKYSKTEQCQNKLGNSFGSSIMSPEGEGTKASTPR
jgi:hypothetical protein